MRADSVVSDTPKAPSTSLSKLLVTSALYTAVTAVLLGLVYPLAVTGVAHLVFPKQANGELIYTGGQGAGGQGVGGQANGQLAGSRLIGQPFTGSGYFHSRPSGAGTGYDATSSSGSNLGPSSKTLADRVAASVHSESAQGPVPVDLVTASGSGLDPDISPAAADYQVERVARESRLPVETVRALVRQNTISRQFGLLGEARVRVLELNLALRSAKGNAGAASGIKP